MLEKRNQAEKEIAQCKNDCQQWRAIGKHRKEASRWPDLRLARREWVLGRLFRGESREIIGRRKFGVREFFTLKPSGADRALGSVIRGPHHLKELVLLVRHDLLAWLKRFNGNNVTTLKLRSRLEMATAVSHILHESLFAEQASGAVDPRDFRGNVYRNALFSSSFDIKHLRRHAYLPRVRNLLGSRFVYCTQRTSSGCIAPEKTNSSRHMLPVLF